MILRAATAAVDVSLSKTLLAWGARLLVIIFLGSLFISSCIVPLLGIKVIMLVVGQDVCSSCDGLWVSVIAHGALGL